MSRRGIRAAFFTSQPFQIDYVYARGRRAMLEDECDFLPEIVTPENFDFCRKKLAGVEVIFSTWGMWALNDAQLDAMPELRAVYYAAGATDHFARPLLKRGIALHSAWRANAIPVAEFCLGQILLAMKGFFGNSGGYRSPEHFRENIGPGCYGDTVGLLGAGAISQKLQELLTNFELNVMVMASRPERRTVSMEEVFRRAFVVSNHLPNRIDNQNVIREEHFLSMRKGAAFINTGRGAQVDEEGMTAALKKRPDLTALLDVAATEPLRADSELYRLPNVRLSGHIAGSFNDEVIRMADYVIGDFRRMRNGETPLHRISEEMLMTH
ncbi:MAG TPA: phosphoglycerate dehydrogenase [Lentisphaeria bacterium]|nr:phosphoglycerate dehydrogenase [Lentisphaeria bacterium]HCG49069.1 phosphoglycerate dehydrogenase [Lentisphaeria bacterium]